MKRKHFSARALFVLLIVPILIAITTFVLVVFLPSLSPYGLSLPIVFVVVVFYPSVLYFVWAFRRVSYSDTAVLDRINIIGAPEEVSNQLKTVSKSHLVNVEIIRFLAKTNRKPIQSEIVKHVIDSGISLTATRIREIIGDLEKMHLISSSKSTYERQYWLTKKGEWCFTASMYYFPKRNWLFVLRNQIVQKEFPPFPEEGEKTSI
jgi:FlaA1/EpsC-like NDP-sugar epimerase